MAQNSQRIAWTSEEVDNKLKGIMESCFKNGLETAKEFVEPAEGEFPSLVAGSNIAGFSKVAAAMHVKDATMKKNAVIGGEKGNNKKQRRVFRMFLYPVWFFCM